MNTVVTSRESILSVSRQYISEHGLSSVNMRAVAAACGVSVGSVYNYFPSKGDLISAVVEDVWHDIFHMPGELSSFSSFPQCVAWIFNSICKGCQEYPEFFSLHSMSFASNEKEKGRLVMNHCFGHIKTNLLVVLQNDSKIRQGIFSETFTPESFVDMVFSLITSMLLQGKKDCSPLLEMIYCCLY